MTDLPIIPGVTLSLDDTPERGPLLTVTGSKSYFTQAVIRESHRIAGENGAAVDFKPS